MTIDIFLNHLRFTMPNSRFFIYHQALVIPDVSESDIRPPRDQEEFNQTRGFNREDYFFPRLNQEISTLYRDYLTNGLPIPGKQRQLSDVPSGEFREALYGSNRHFVFIIASFNNAKWYARNLDSVMEQDYPFWRGVYIDDGSTDGTGKLVALHLEKSNMSHRFTVIGSQTRRLQSYSRYLAYHMCHDDEICVFLDGDDWLSNRSVLSYLNRFYVERNLQATYQSYLIYLGGRITESKQFKPFPKAVRVNRDFRYYSWTAFHLRTCQAKFIKKIDFRDFTDLLGNFITCCSDVVEANCYLELVDIDKHHRTDRHLVVYNKDNSQVQPNSSYSRERLHQEYRDSVIRSIRSRQKYQWQDRKGQLVLCDVASPDLVPNVNKYYHEMCSYADLLVVPFDQKHHYQSLLTGYEKVLEMDQYESQSKSQLCPWSSRVVLVTYLIYIEQARAALPAHWQELEGGTDAEYLFLFNGVKPFGLGPNRPKNCHFFHFEKRRTVDHCWKTGVALSNGQWIMTVDLSARVNFSAVNRLLIQLRAPTYKECGLVVASYLVLDQPSHASFPISPGKLTPGRLSSVGDLEPLDDPVIGPLIRKEAFHSVCHCQRESLLLYDTLWLLLIGEKHLVFQTENLLVYDTTSKEYMSVKKGALEARQSHSECLGSRKEQISLLKDYYDYMKLGFPKSN
jgi:glycosyltransferase involved in cell wall biosynthesis